MKNYLKLIVVLFFLFSSILYSQKKVYQYDIKVQNKFLYARVFYKGKLVDNLNKKDFILYENGKKER